MLIAADDGLPAENSRDEAWFRTSRSRSAVSRTLSCDSTGASAKPSKTRSASPTAARPTRPGHTQYSDMHPSRPSVTPQPPAHNGGFAFAPRSQYVTRLSVAGNSALWFPLPGGTGRVGGNDIGRVPVQAAAVPIRVASWSAGRHGKRLLAGRAARS